VDDIPSPENCLHGAFVYSQEAFAKVQHIDLKAALESAGIVTYVSALDVPKFFLLSRRNISYTKSVWFKDTFGIRLTI
jgi:xanthine dehydrogenase molybdopterin-binding subunit B